MPWQEQSAMSLKQEFVTLASREGANLTELCARFQISRPTGYAWLRRYQDAGVGGLAERSRAPASSPGQTDPDVAAAVLALRDRHPAWGGRKLRARLLAVTAATGGVVASTGDVAPVPAASTITAILRRGERLAPAESTKHTAWQRFEHPAPNDLWQLDFKGHVALAGGGRCHPLTILDDHSRFLLGLGAYPNEQDATVRVASEAAFRRYGLPARILCDNGPPWGVPQVRHTLTALGVWLIRLGVGVVHGRPIHPQTQGKAERFHRTLLAEVLRPAVDRGPTHRDLAAAQTAFDAWRDVYNLERPHEALGLVPPIHRYTPSRRPFPGRLPEPEYGPGDAVRAVHGGGQLSYRGRLHFVGTALRGHRVALRPTSTDGVLGVYFCHHRVGRLDLRTRVSSILPSGEGEA